MKKTNQRSKNKKLIKDSSKKAREIRENMDEKKIDKMIKDSFPASDPPSTY